MILRKEIYASICCCFLLTPGIKAAPNNGVQGDSWNLQMHRSGDGPINVESEHSRFDENGVIETKKEVGELAVDDTGKVYIKKNDEQNPKIQEEQAIHGNFHRPENRESHVLEERVHDDIGDVRIVREFDERSSHQDFSNCPIVQRIDRELFEIRELIARRDVAHSSEDDLDPSEKYHIVKKKLKKIKKMSRALFGVEKKPVYGKRKFKENCPWYKKIFRRDFFPNEENLRFERKEHNQEKRNSFWNE